MALVRCLNHKPDEARVKEPYVGYVDPYGLSSSGVICGRSSCEEVGKIWLSGREASQFKNGIRIFPVQSSSVKVRAGETPLIRARK